MEFIVAGFEIIEQEPGIKGIYKAAELPGRICYGSQDKIAEGTAESFCMNLIKSNHGAPLEHGTVYLMAPINYEYDDIDFECNGSALDKYNGNPYSKIQTDGSYVYVTTNLRVLFENDWMSDLDNYLCEPTEFHERRYQVRFVIDRFTGEEFIRHRKASVNRESTRYVTFTKEKFGGGSIKFIVPVWMLDKMDKLKKRYESEDVSYFAGSILESERTGQPLSDVFYWAAALKVAEWSYSKLVNECGWKAQQARTVLPCAINSPLIKTAFISDWVHFFKLRSIGTTGKPHPQAEELATPLMEEFIKRGYLKKNDYGLSISKIK